MLCKGCIHTKGNYTQTSFVKDFATAPVVSSKLFDHPDSISRKIWADKTITWQLLSDTPSIPGRNIEIEIFKKVFLQIGMYIPNRIIQLNKSTADADIRINFSKDDPFWTERPSTLAYAYGPQVGIGGDVTFNTKNYVWTEDGAPMNVVKAYDLGLIAGYSNPNNTIKTYKTPHTGVHEVEHAMGCPHIAKEDCPGAVINPIYNGNIFMQQCEIAVLQKFYGKVNLSQQQIADMKARIEKPIVV